jgi:hypothetical protein
MLGGRFGRLLTASMNSAKSAADPTGIISLQWPMSAAGRFCCRSQLMNALADDSVSLTRFVAEARLRLRGPHAAQDEFTLAAIAQTYGDSPSWSFAHRQQSPRVRLSCCGAVP